MLQVSAGAGRLCIRAVIRGSTGTDGTPGARSHRSNGIRRFDRLCGQMTNA
jgi:hypothetical protein